MTALAYRAKRLPGWAMLLGWALLVLLPIYLLLVSCFKTTQQIYAHPLTPPGSWSLANFRHAWAQADFARYFVNSLVVSVGAVLITITVCLLAAYPLSRYRLWWGNALLGVFLVGIMVPARLASVEMFNLLKSLGLLDSRLGLVLVFTAMRIPFGMLIFANFMRVIPRELEEAARMDGAAEWRVLFRVILPQMRPAVGVVAVFTGIAVWNDFYFPLLFTFDEGKKTLPLAIAGFVGQYNTDWGMLFAGLAMSMIPLVFLYLAASRQVQQAMGEGAVR
ncbi:carbohydrate ABC transporter permease [Actinoallomurus acaciae]|uniref:Carbohydrate ABC transporter permease n=1 Tax=Actinoallomurus acaciae TaxID=502577 RepID=A0ABV5YJI0_9ACTN